MTVPAVVSEIFGDFVGHACEVGANDGVFGSMTLGLEKSGWTVLCVEANPECAESGRKFRRQWMSVAAGAVDSDAHPFSIFSEGAVAPGDSALGTESRYRLGSPPQAKRTFTVPVRRLDRILEEAGFPRLDLLMVDVEGWEPEVLAGINLFRWNPRVIVLEDWMDSYPSIYGYGRVRRMGYDNIYVRHEA